MIGRTWAMALAMTVATTISSVAPAARAAPAAPAPTLEYAFTAKVTLAPAVEQGEIGGGRRRFIAITGGSVDGPLFHGRVLPGGGDWQTILPDGLTQVDARYFLQAADGTVVDVNNPGVRVASTAVTERIARGEDVPSDAYYFRTTPRLAARAGPFAWMNRSVFVARGIRKPDHVEIDFYVVR
ncbi:UNVERIFIED_ORG: hypothetical protein M2348_004168 [Sphingomonas sp. R1F5B]